MTRKKRLLIVFVVMLMAITTVSAYAYAQSDWYVIDEANMTGPTRVLGPSNKEYASVAVNTDNKASVTVLLYARNSWSGSQWFGNDQVLNYGTDRRAWWIGDNTTSREYYIATSTTASEMNLSGYFRTF